MGALDAYYEDGLKEWDWAAGVIIITKIILFHYYHYLSFKL